jgi:hypothetical protein
MKVHSAALALAGLVGFTGGRVQAQSFEYGFESDYQGWIGDFADYPVADSVHWHLGHRIDTLPDILPKQSGLVLKGDNFSDDLFLFLKRKLTGLSPNTAYAIAFSIDIATDQGAEIIGGSDLFLKAGAVLMEPKKLATQESSTMFRMNLDKGNQASEGKDMQVFGHVEHPFHDTRYHLVTFANASRPFRIKTGPEGELWIIVGAESAFETSNVRLNVAAVRFALSTATGVADPRPGPRMRLPQAARTPWSDWTLTGRKLPRAAL